MTPLIDPATKLPFPMQIKIITCPNCGSATLMSRTVGGKTERIELRCWNCDCVVRVTKDG